MTPNFFMYYVPAMTSPAGKRGAAAAAAAAIAQRAASSPEDSSSQVPTPSLLAGEAVRGKIQWQKMLVLKMNAHCLALSEVGKVLSR